MIFRIADDHDLAAERSNDLSFRDRLRRVVGALALKIGLERLQQSRGTLLVKNRHVRHAANRGDDLRALTLVHQRTIRTLQHAHRIITVHTDDENIGDLRRALQISNVTNVKNIEDAVRESDPFA